MRTRHFCFAGSSPAAASGSLQIIQRPKQGVAGKEETETVRHRARQRKLSPATLRLRHGLLTAPHIALVIRRGGRKYVQCRAACCCLQRSLRPAACSAALRYAALGCISLPLIWVEALQAAVQPRSSLPLVQAWALLPPSQACTLTPAVKACALLPPWQACISLPPVPQSSTQVLHPGTSGTTAF